MKHVLSAIFLAIFGLAMATSVSAGDFQVSQADLKALEKDLMKSSLRREDLKDDDFDDDDDDEPSKRGWNPISWVKNQFKNRCVCENNKCDCCFKLKLFKSKACFSAETLSAEKKVQISFNLDDKNLVNRRFDLQRSDSVCGPVPVPALAFLKFCFTQQSGVEANGAISSCSSVEFKVGDTTGAVLQFECLELKNGKVTFGGHNKLEKSAMFVLQAKNPFKAAVKLYKKATGKKN